MSPKSDRCLVDDAKPVPHPHIHWPPRLITYGRAHTDWIKGIGHAFTRRCSQMISKFLCDYVCVKIVRDLIVCLNDQPQVCTSLPVQPLCSVGQIALLFQVKNIVGGKNSKMMRSLNKPTGIWGINTMKYRHTTPKNTSEHFCDFCDLKTRCHPCFFG